MKGISLRVKIGVLVVLAALLAGGGVLWWQRLPLLSWYHVRGLSQATEAEREACAERVVDLGDAGLAALLTALSQTEEPACANVAFGLDLMGRRWGLDDPRCLDLAARMTDAMDRASPAGRAAVLSVLNGWLPAMPALAETASQAVARAVEPAASDVHGAALALTETLLEQKQLGDNLADVRALVQACLRGDDAGQRVRAVRLAVLPELALLDQVMPLMHDPSAEVRREVMIAAREAPEDVVKTDDLLHWLHDSDEDVRRLCESVLTLRGMTRDQVKLGRMLTDADAAVRLGVVGALQTADDLEPGVWLRLLSVDPEPAVRIAAVRFAADHPVVDLSDRIDQMAQSDPSPTVRQLAQSYLRMPPPRKVLPPRP